MSRKESQNIGARFHYEMLSKKLDLDSLSGETPTTFVPLSPEKIELANGSADILYGVFHVKWSDMPKPSTYSIRIADRVTGDGKYAGSRLECKHPKNLDISLSV